MFTNEPHFLQLFDMQLDIKTFINQILQFL